MSEQDRYRREIFKYAEYKLELSLYRPSAIWREHRAFLAPMEAKRHFNQRNRKARDCTYISEENWRFSPL